MLQSSKAPITVIEKKIPDQPDQSLVETYVKPPVKEVPDFKKLHQEFFSKVLNSVSVKTQNKILKAYEK